MARIKYMSYFTIPKKPESILDNSVLGFKYQISKNLCIKSWKKLCNFNLKTIAQDIYETDLPKLDSNFAK